MLRRVLIRCLVAAIASIAGQGSSFAAQTRARAEAAAVGAEVYRSACAACHGVDGKGAARDAVGFDTPLPDFTKCGFATSEPDDDWSSTIHVGGRVRGLSPNMPAFGAALTDTDIESAIAYIRGFCAKRAWPGGNLNAPRALVTEKAFPDNEAFATVAVPISNTDRVETRFVYERRLGPRAQYDLVVPFRDMQWPGGWNHGLGDITAGAKQVVFADAAHGSIVSAGADVTLPTGNETKGLGNRLAVFEPYASFSQLLPGRTFVHAQTGIGFPLNVSTANDEFFWRTAVGHSVAEKRWGRIWSPIVEVIGSRELEFGERAKWDLLPQLQVTLNRRRHIAASGGIRTPLNLRTRSGSAVVSLLWGWSQGGLLAGW